MEAEALACRGHSLTVIGWDRDAHGDSRCHQNVVEYVRLVVRSTHGRGITQPIFLAGFWLRALPVIRQLRPDVIHCHDLDTLPLGWWASRSLGVALVFDAHENYPDMMVGHLPSIVVKMLRQLERRLVPRCDLVITVGNRLAEHYRQMGASQAVVVGNWKDPADFKFPAETIAQTRQELGLRNGVIAICFVANLSPATRFEPLMAAIAGDRRFALVIGGDGPQAKIARSYAHKYDNIIYLGRVNPNRVPLITASCDIVYFGYDERIPHAHWAVPNKLYEAIAAGKPILSGDCGEVGELLRIEECGILTDTKDPNCLIHTLEQIVLPSVFSKMGASASSLQTRFCRHLSVECLESAYDKLCRIRPEPDKKCL